MGPRKALFVKLLWPLVSYQTIKHCNMPTGTPNKNHDFQSGFGIDDWCNVYYCERFNGGVRSTLSTKRRRSFIVADVRWNATQQWILFYDNNLRRVRRREQNTIYEVANNKRLCSWYCTAEAKCRWTRNIACLCDRLQQSFSFTKY